LVSGRLGVNLGLYARIVAWHFEHSADSPASPEAVWQRYVDVAHWNEWSRKGIQWSRLEGTFEVETKLEPA